MAEIVVLPVVRIERQDDARSALFDIFGGKVGADKIEVILKELHRRGFRIEPFVTEEIAP